DLRRVAGVDVAVVVTDTMGRSWRVGQTDVAIGTAGVEVLHRYLGMVDGQGNELLVTEIAVADELAGAADLVKGKLGGLPVAVVRGLHPLDDGSTARDLVRPLDEDLFRLGTEEALAQGRREAVLLRRSARAFTDERSAWPSPRPPRTTARRSGSPSSASAAPRCWTPWPTAGASTSRPTAGPPPRSSAACAAATSCAGPPSSSSPS